MAPLLSLLAAAGLLLDMAQAAAVSPDQHVLRPDRELTSMVEPLEKVRQELQKAEIIPTVIDDFHPCLILEAKWSPNNQASLGNTLKPYKLQDAPSISLHAPSSNLGNILRCDNTTPNSSRTTTTYVITLTDPDAPSRDDPKWSEMCHWIIAISPSSSAGFNAFMDVDSNTRLVALNPDMTDGGDIEDEIIPYKPPGPPEKTGKHRYVLLAFVPANGTTERIYPSKPKDRKHWGYDGPDEDTGKTHGVRDWAEENGLVAVAANFIYAKNKK